MRAPNRSDCYVAILVSGLLRYANESFQENLPHLQQLNPHCTFHVFVSTSSMSTFGSEDIKHARRFISNGTASNGTASNGMQESQLPPEKSRAPTTVMIEHMARTSRMPDWPLVPWKPRKACWPLLSLLESESCGGVCKMPGT